MKQKQEYFKYKVCDFIRLMWSIVKFLMINN